MNKLQDQIADRNFKRGLEGAKKLVDRIIGNLDAVHSSDRLSKTDVISITQLKLELKEGILEPLISAYSFFDPRTCPIGATFLWHLIGTVYRAGQLAPHGTIVEDILAPEFRKAQSKLASDARRADKIQEIIDRLSHDLWARKPEFRGNARGTAATIRPAFNLEVAALKNIPTEWEPVDSNDTKAVKQQIERIRKRIPKM